MDERQRVIAAVLGEPDGRAAIADGDRGSIVRLARVAVGWSQTELAARSGYSQATISRIERGTTRAARDSTVLDDLAQTLAIPPSALGLSAACDGQAGNIDDVHRRDLLSGAAALTAAALLPQSIASPAGQIGADEIAQCRANLNRLYQIDDHQGGEGVHLLAAGMASRLHDALRRATYSPSVGRQLQVITATAMEHAGWTAFDAGWSDKARRWWLEACHLSDLSDARDARVTALASMALQASADPTRGRETVALADAAAAAAGPHAAPALQALIAARAAIGHAHSGDRHSATAAIVTAHRELGRGRRGDEPAWLDFWGPADLACHEMQVALALDDGRSAEVAARTALMEIDAKAYPRNHALYTARLGSVLVRRGRLDESMAVTGEALQHAVVVGGSRRIVSALRQTVERLGRQDYPPARQFAAAAHRVLPGS